MNNISEINSNIILQSKSTTKDFKINSVSPKVILNNGIITVSYSTLNASINDWIGAFSPPDVDIRTKLPAKYGFAFKGSENYLITGIGSLDFNMTNLRAGIRFYYFSNGLLEPILEYKSLDIVNFEDINEPLRNRIQPTGDYNTFQLHWSSATSSIPQLHWGTSPKVYPNIVNAISFQIDRNQVCGSPANSTGWHDLGMINKALFTDIVTQNLYGKSIYYIFGEKNTNKFSKEFIFRLPPYPGNQPLNRPTQVVLMADLGIGSSVSASNTLTWQEEGSPAVDTAMSIGDYIRKGQIDAIIHSGDISYANGHIQSYDFFMDMISPIAGSVIYLTTVGNHESDWVNTETLQYELGKSSGGECGLFATTLLPMPTPATRFEPWYSYNIGLIHFVGMSTEHDYNYGSKQYQFIENDLKTVNREITPWIIFSGHRPVYVNSIECCEFGSDVNVAENLQKHIEPLLHKYRVNLAFSGHHHSIQRISAVYQNKIIQKSTYIIDKNGHLIAFHNNPKATIYHVIGTAGNGPDYDTGNHNWNERNFTNVFGYAIVTAINSTLLEWKLIESSSGKIIDRMTITQDLNVKSWDNNWSTLSFVLLTFFCVVAMMTGYWIFKWRNSKEFGYVSISSKESSGKNDFVQEEEQYGTFT